MKDALVFLVEAYLKPVLSYSSEVGHCEVDFYNIHIELHQISTEILKQEIIELVRLSTTESVRNVGFSSPCISIGTGSCYGTL